MQRKPFVGRDLIFGWAIYHSFGGILDKKRAIEKNLDLSWLGDLVFDEVLLPNIWFCWCRLLQLIVVKIHKYLLINLVGTKKACIHGHLNCLFFYKVRAHIVDHFLVNLLTHFVKNRSKGTISNLYVL